MKNRIIVAATLLFVCIGAYSSHGQSAQPSISSGSIEGIVSTAAGERLADVVVSAQYGRIRLSATTAADGTFRIENVRPGPYSLTATSQAGFVMPDITSSGGTSRVLGKGGLVVVLKTGEHVKDIHIEMIATGTGIVAGLLLDDRGQPRTSQRLELQQKEYDRDGKPLLQMRKNKRTNDKGEYRFFDVLPGEYYLAATDSDQKDSAVYYPGVWTMQQAISITVTVGGEFHAATFVYPSRPHSELHVIRLALNGPSTTTMTFRLIPQDEFGHPALRLNVESHDGTYALAGIPVGKYKLLIGTQDPLLSGRTIDVEVGDKDVDLGSITLNPTVSIPVHVRFIDGVNTPPAGWQAPRLRPIGLSDDGTLFPDNISHSYEHVAEGIYRIDERIRHSVVSATYKGHDVFTDGLIVSADAMPGTLEVTVGSEGGISGIVHNAKSEPVANARVAMIPTGDRRSNPDLVFTALTDQKGAFSMLAVPGDYGVLAWEFTPANAYKNEEWRKEYDGQAVHVSLGHGSKEVLDLRVIPKKK